MSTARGHQAAGTGRDLSSRRVCVFCGSREGASPAHRRAAEELGAGIGRRGLTLVYGGANVGLMGILADATLAAGGGVIGVLPSPLFEREVAHTGLTELRIVGSMHERKALMADLSDCFLALPGGVGTLDEWCEIFSWAQLGIHRKPFGLLNVEGYFGPLLELLDRMVLEGFLSPPQRALPLVSPSPGQLLDLLAAASRRAAGQAPPPPLDPSVR